MGCIRDESLYRLNDLHNIFAAQRDLLGDVPCYIRVRVLVQTRNLHECKCAMHGTCFVYKVLDFSAIAKTQIQ